MSDVQNRDLTPLAAPLGHPPMSLTHQPPSAPAHHIHMLFCEQSPHPKPQNRL